MTDAHHVDVGSALRFDDLHPRGLGDGAEQNEHTAWDTDIFVIIIEAHGPRRIDRAVEEDAVPGDTLRIVVEVEDRRRERGYVDVGDIDLRRPGDRRESGCADRHRDRNRAKKARLERGHGRDDRSVSDDRPRSERRSDRVTYRGADSALEE